MNSNFNRKSDFDRNFNLMGRLFWVMFAVVLMLIFGQFALMGWAGYQLVTNPEAVGTIAADMIRPVADAVRGE